MQTIDIVELAGAQRGLAVVAAPVVIRDRAPSGLASGLRVIAAPAAQEALQAVNAQGAEVGPIGCRFVRDITVLGSGYVFHGEALVTDGSHLSDVAIEWVERPMPDSPRALKPARERFVDELAIVAIGPGHLIYGHWLVDFIPRFVIAKEALGRAYADAKLVLPHDTPRWALTMLHAFTGAEESQFAFYERGIERLALRNACIPSYVHDDYAFHPFADEIFAGLVPLRDRSPLRRLCISRAAFEGATHGVQKLFETRVAFEAEAVRRGYEIVRPETMGIREQAALFASASHVVGEYGSALHSAVFGPSGLRIGYIRCPNRIQLRISAMRRQPSAVVLPADDRVAETGVAEYSLTASEMSALFDANEA